MSRTLTVYNRHGIEAPLLARELADTLHAPVTTGLDEQMCATFTAEVSEERLVEAAEFYLPWGGWGVGA